MHYSQRQQQQEQQQNNRNHYNNDNNNDNDNDNDSNHSSILKPPKFRQAESDSYPKTGLSMEPPTRNDDNNNNNNIYSNEDEKKEYNHDGNGNHSSVSSTVTSSLPSVAAPDAATATATGLLHPPERTRSPHPNATNDGMAHASTITDTTAATAKVSEPLKLASIPAPPQPKNSAVTTAKTTRTTNPAFISTATPPRAQSIGLPSKNGTVVLEMKKQYENPNAGSTTATTSTNITAVSPKNKKYNNNYAATATRRSPTSSPTRAGRVSPTNQKYSRQHHKPESASIHQQDTKPPALKTSPPSAAVRRRVPHAHAASVASSALSVTSDSTASIITKDAKLPGRITNNNNNGGFVAKRRTRDLQLAPPSSSDDDDYDEEQNYYSNNDRYHSSNAVLDTHSLDDGNYPTLAPDESAAKIAESVLNSKTPGARSNTPPNHSKLPDYSQKPIPYASTAPHTQQQHKKQYYDDNQDVAKKLVSMQHESDPNQIMEQQNTNTGPARRELPLPGAYGISPDNRPDSIQSYGVGDRSLSREESKFYQVKATLVEKDTESNADIIRQEILNNAVSADVVDTDKERKSQFCRVCICVCLLLTLAIGLSVGLARRNSGDTPAIQIITQAPTTPAPTMAPSQEPSPAPTPFSIVQCSPFVTVLNLNRYIPTWEQQLQLLNATGVNIPSNLDELLADQSQCTPQAVASLQLAIDTTDYVNIPNDGIPPVDNDLLTRYALGVWFFATGGDTSWFDTTNWLSGDLCDWSGVQCRGNSNSLQAVDFSGNGLVGTFPSELALLVQLERFAANGNQLSGTLPTEIGFMTNLLNFEIRENFLTGSLITEIGNLDRLRLLDITRNDFTNSLPSELGTANQLEDFLLNGNQFNGTIPTEIGAMIELSEFRASDNLLSGDIPSEFGNLVRLREVSLSNNFINGRLPMELLQADRLETLRLSGNILTGNFPSNLSALTRLITLDISQNFIEGTLPSEIGLLLELELLDIRDNRISSPIPTQIGLMTRLEVFNVEENSLSGMIPSEFGNLNRLTALLARDNRLEGFPTEFGLLTSLQILVLTGNDLETRIPTEVGGLVRLAELECSRCDLRGPIPTEIGNLSLTRLDLRDNRLVGTLPQFLPESLNVFDVSDNDLERMIPDNLDIPRIVTFDVSRNRLEGTLPNKFGSFIQLVELSVRDNNGLFGTVPMSFSNLSSLETLELDGTSIGGRIDDSICLLTTEAALDDIDISCNRVECDCCNCRGGGNGGGGGGGMDGGNGGGGGGMNGGGGGGMNGPPPPPPPPRRLWK